MLMRTSAIGWLVVAVVIISGGWYWYTSMLPMVGDGYVTPTTPNTSSTTTTTPSGDGSSINDNLTLGTDSTSTLGTYLIGYNGMTVYVFSKDGNGTSTCYGSCATTWPPYIVPGGMQLHLESGVNGNAATITRADGTTQVTYNGRPLYFYSGDTTGSDIKGQGVGGVWSIVKP